jgi:hypothetical protein
MDMHDEEREFPEREALAALRRDVPASDVLEERTVRALAERGLLLRSRRSRAQLFTRIAAVAACAAFFVGGYALGTRRTAPARDTATIYSGEMRDEPVGQAPADTSGAASTTELSFAAPDSTAAATRKVVWF